MLVRRRTRNPCQDTPRALTAGFHRNHFGKMSLRQPASAPYEQHLIGAVRSVTLTLLRYLQEARSLIPAEGLRTFALRISHGGG